MQKKSIFVSAIEKDENAVRTLFGKIKSYGMDVNGHFWNHDEKEITKEIPSQEVEQCDAWVIYAPNVLEKKAMIGLSLTLLTVRTHSDHQVPVIFVGPEQPLPPLFATAEFCTPEKLGVRLASRTAIKKKWPENDFLLCAHNQPGVGYWLEIGPSKETWKGVLAGVDTSLGAVLDFQAVGPKGMLPERTILEFPFKDAKLSSGGIEYTAWGCKNELKDGDAFFIRIKGAVPSIIIGEGLAEDESMDCRVIKLSV